MINGKNSHLCTGKTEEACAERTRAKVKQLRLSGKRVANNYGSPHYVTFSENIDQIDINLEGSNIRNSTPFKKKGINVNFVQVDDSVKMRTYERGVESETLSCGTGAVASAIALFHKQIINENIIELNTRGGVLIVSFDNFKNEYKNIWLTGEANLVYIGEFEC